MKAIRLICVINIFISISLLNINCERRFDNPLDPSVHLGSPTDLKSERISNLKIILTWKDNSQNEQGFQIARSKNGSPFSVIGNSAKDCNNFTDSLIDPIDGNEYRYTVRAYIDQRTTTQSNEARILILDAPKSLMVTLDSSQLKATLTWRKQSISSIKTVVEVRDLIDTVYHSIWEDKRLDCKYIIDMSAFSAFMNYDIRLRNVTDSSYSLPSNIISLEAKPDSLWCSNISASGAFLMSFFPDKKHLLMINDYPPSITVVDVSKSAQIVWSDGFPTARIASAASSSDGKFVYAEGWGCLRIWDAMTGNRILTDSTSIDFKNINSCGMTNTAFTACVNVNDSTIRCSEMSLTSKNWTHSKEYRVPGWSSLRAASCPDGSHIVVSGWKNYKSCYLRVINKNDFSTAIEKVDYGLFSGNNQHSFSPDGRYLALEKHIANSGTTDAIEVISLQEGKTIFSLKMTGWAEFINSGSLIIHPTDSLNSNQHSQNSEFHIAYLPFGCHSYDILNIDSDKTLLLATSNGVLDNYTIWDQVRLTSSISNNKAFWSIRFPSGLDNACFGPDDNEFVIAYHGISLWKCKWAVFDKPVIIQ